MCYYRHSLATWKPQFRGYGILLCLGLALSLFGSTQAAKAQTVESPPSISLATARADNDGNGQPDRLGDTVQIAGIATTGSHDLASDHLELYVQDHESSLNIIADRVDATVAPGDSVVATGVLEQFNGLTRLRASSYHVYQSNAPPIAPLRTELFDPETAETLEGHLITLEGSAFNMQATAAGRYFVLSTSPDFSLVVFIQRSREEEFDFANWTNNTPVRVTGILGQWDREPPYNTGYQLYPRTPDDIEVIDRSQAFYQMVVAIVLGLLVLVGTWVIALRIEVKRQARRLADSERRLRTVFEGVTDAILVASLDRVIQQVNPASTELLGIPSETLLTQPLDKFLNEDGLHWLDTATQDALRHKTVQKDLHIVHEDERTTLVSATLSAVDFDGEPHLLFVCRDISAYHAIQSALKESKEKAERLTDQKSALIASMSHEMRTPLTSIIGFASVMEHSLQGEEHKMIGLVHRAGIRLLGLVNNLLDMARLESDHHRLHPSEFLLADLLDELVRLLEPMAHAKELALTLEMPHRNLWVHVDREALHRIVENLMTNAIKYTDEGHVTIRVKLSKDGWTLAVADTGPGIPESFRPHLFEEFRRVHATSSDQQTGSGLGLALTHRLVQALGGQIRVDSTVGKGSTFNVEFAYSHVMLRSGHAAVLS